MAARKYFAAAVVVVALAVTASVVAQGALAQFKVTEAQMRDAIISELSGSLGGHPNRPSAEMARKAYASIPASARGPATTALYGWTKAHVNSAAFKSFYAAYRKENTPVESPHPGTVDEEVARVISAEKAALDKSVKDYLAAGMKAQADAMRQQGKMFDDKSYLQMQKISVAEKRASDKERYERGMAIFNETLPADPLVRVAAHLRAFVDATPDVDFAAKQEAVQGEGGTSMRFVNAAYRQKPWQWQVAYAFGPEALAAARAAAQSWLKELGK